MRLIARQPRQRASSAPIELRHARTQRRCITAVMSLFAGIAAAAFWHDMQSVRDLQRQAHTREQALTQVQRRWHRQTAVDARATRSLTFSTSVPGILALIDRLGPALSPDIALRRIEAMPDAATLRVAFEARDVTSMIDFATRLGSTFDIQWHHSASRTVAAARIIEASMTLRLRTQGRS